jgi:NADPH:quinone reductase
MVKYIAFQEGSAKIVKEEDAQLPDGHILIKNRYIGFNQDDLEIHRRSVNSGNEILKIGFEGSGVVKAVGANVQRTLKEGDRVCFVTQNPGAFCDNIIVPQTQVFKTYDEVSDEVAATIRKGLLAHTILYQVYKIPKKSWVLINGATGGLGSVLCQWARAVGLNVIAVCSNDSKVGKAGTLEVNHVVNYKKDDLVSAVMHYTNNIGVDYVIDIVGKDFYNIGTLCLRYFGMYASIGDLSGKITDLEIDSLKEKSLFFTRPNLIHYKFFAQYAIVGALEFFELASQNKIRPIMQSYSFKQLSNVVDLMKTGSNFGSVVVHL